jgi:hypothetical protein
MAKKFWWPTTLALQSLFFQNFQAKIGSYAAILGLTPAQVTAAQELCDAFIGSLNFVEQSRATMAAATQWRDLVFYGEPVGDPAGPSPVFPIGGNPPYTRGVVTQMYELRDLILALPGYTTAIGEDLGLIGSEIMPPPENDVAPSLKTSVSTGYWVNISGSMQGMDGLRIEYRPKGGNYSPVAFFTNTPGSFQVSPAAEGEPENGSVRAIFIKKNAEYGEFSPEYPVTVY